jgi:hypothetical protein
MDNYFSELNAVDVSKSVEKKGRFTYLSWPHAVAELGKRHPKATWNVKHFPMVMEGSVHPDIQVPYLQTPCGYFVEVEVTVDDVTKTQVHPILDNYNKPIASPNSFQINTSIQRALAKAIALHGLGLYVFAGEDLPEVSQINPDPIDNEKVKKAVQQAHDVIDNEDPEMITTPKDARAIYEPLSNDERIAFQGEMKTTKIGKKTAWSVFHEYLKLAADQAA